MQFYYVGVYLDIAPHNQEKKELLSKVHSRIFYVRHLFGAFRNSVTLFFFLKLVVVVNFFKVHVKEKVHTLSFRSF